MSGRPAPAPVSLTVPAFADQLHLVRLLTAGVAGATELDADEVEDLKIAVEELGAVLLGPGGIGDELRATISAGPGAVVVIGQRSWDGSPIELDDFLVTILDAVVDRYRIEVTGEQATFRVEKDLRGR